MIPSGTPDYHEPLLHERIYYRHRQTGDRGYSVRREGRDAIRKDRPNVDDYAFNVGEWAREKEVLEKYSAIQIAQVCFEADKKLCWALGLPDLAKREWLDMSEKQRLKWVKDGPPEKFPERVGLYSAIQKQLRSANGVS